MNISLSSLVEFHSILDVFVSAPIHDMDLLWEKFQWILLLYMKPIRVSIKGFSCLFSHRSHIYWFLPEESKCVFPTYWWKNKWISEFLKQITRNWNVDAFCTSCFLRYYLMMQHQLLWKELMERMIEHTGLISSYQLFITAACTNTGGKTKGSHSRVADRCPFVPRHSLSQVTHFMQLGMLCDHFSNSPNTNS